MTRSHAFASITLGAAAAGLLLWRKAQAAAAPTLSGTLDGALLALPDAIAQPLESLTMDWQQALDTRGAPYKAAFAAAENRYGLPPFMLARMAWQESHYRPDIINGGPNAEGAIGILQIIPKWHPGVDPSNPFASIDYAGSYMAQLYSQFGLWQLALAAYNWGPGNLTKWLNNGGTMPQETQAYWGSILADVNTANGTEYA